jgi:hypothetical protein
MMPYLVQISLNFPWIFLLLSPHSLLPQTFAFIFVNVIE